MLCRWTIKTVRPWGAVRRTVMFVGMWRLRLVAGVRWSTVHADCEQPVDSDSEPRGYTPAPDAEGACGESAGIRVPQPNCCRSVLWLCVPWRVLALTFRWMQSTRAGECWRRSRCQPQAPAVRQCCQFHVNHFAIRRAALWDAMCGHCSTRKARSTPHSAEPSCFCTVQTG